MKEICLKATLENMGPVNAFVEGELEAVDCPPRAAMKLMVALEELYVNIAHYAYAEETGDAVIQVETQPGKARIRLIDCGMAYDPLSHPEPDLTLSAEDRPIGGLGLYMVKKSMDVFTYERKNGRNIVLIEKSWGSV